MVHGTKAFMAGAADLRRRWLQVPWWISADTRFTLNERLFLAMLVDHPVQSGTPRLLTDKYISKRLGWSRQTIYRTIKSLECKHLVRCSYLRRKGLRCPLRMVELNTYQMGKIKAKYGPGADRYWRWDYSLVVDSDLSTREIAVLGIVRSYAECGQKLSRSCLRTLAGISTTSEDRIIRKFKQLGVIDVEYTMRNQRTTRRFTVTQKGFDLVKKPQSSLFIPAPTCAKKTEQEAVHCTKKTDRNPGSMYQKDRAYILSNTSNLSKNITDAQTSFRDGECKPSVFCAERIVEEVMPPAKAAEPKAQLSTNTSTSVEVVVHQPADPFIAVKKSKVVASPTSEKVLDEDVVRGRDLFSTIKKHKRRPSNTKPSTLAAGFTALREIDGIENRDIDAVLVWYRDHFGDKYTPKIFSSAGFREKWNELWEAYQRSIDENPPIDQFPEIRKAIDTFSKRVSVPTAIQKQFPAFCFKSIRNQNQWRSAMQKHFKDCPKTYYIAPGIGSKYLDILRSAKAFMPDYFHEIIRRYDKFSSYTGDIGKHAWTPDCNYEIDRLVRGGVFPLEMVDGYRSFVKEVLRNADQAT